MFEIKMDCWDCHGGHYTDTPAINTPCFYKESAYAIARDMAEEEVESLNDGAIPEVHFGIFEDETPDEIRVNYYYNEENDTTGNTELVTKYYFEEAKLNPELEEIFSGFTEMQKHWFDQDHPNIESDFELEAAIKESLGSASNYHLWTLGSDTQEQAESYEETADELRGYAEKLKAIKSLIKEQ